MRKLFHAVAVLALAGASPAVAETGLYLRVDGGGAFSMGMTFADTDPTSPNSTLGTTTFSGTAGNSAIGDAGIGFRFTPALRVDVTGSYIPYLRFEGTDNQGTGTLGTVNIRPRVGLVNGYVDFAWLAGMPLSGINPYLVASLGASNNQLGTFTLSNSGATETLNAHTNLSFAWGVGAGVGIPLGRFVTFDLMYKYLDLGQLLTSAQTSSGSLTPITSQLHLNTVTAGFRFNF
jgi:opacity protein-like surface antigen